MFRNKTIIPCLLALWLVLSFAGCASETASDVPVPSNSKAYLQVKVSVDGDVAKFASRADETSSSANNPDGGENGNGRELGNDNENKVSKIALLLYTPSSSSTGDLTDGNATIAYVFTFDQITEENTSTSGGNNIEKVWKSSVKEIDPNIMTQEYHALVVTNYDGLSFTKGMTLEKVRDYLVTRVCTRATAIGDFKDFVMSSSEDAQLKLEGNEGKGTETDPYILNVNVERLAARIDIEPNATYATDGYYYNVKDGDQVIGGFKLESVVPTKVMTSGEYLIKRVSASQDLSKLVYFGKEAAGDDKKTTNYIVCPWTKDHTKAQYSANGEGTEAFYKAKQVDMGKSFILDYVMENTTTDNSETYSTGLAFKGKYYESSEWDATNTQPKANATGTAKEYTYTIRHSDPTGKGTTSDPMYYGIVRNNIYRVRIEGVIGKAEGLKLTINVRKWATYTHEEATM